MSHVDPHAVPNQTDPNNTENLKMSLYKSIVCLHIHNKTVNYSHTNLQISSNVHMLTHLNPTFLDAFPDVPACWLLGVNSLMLFPSKGPDGMEWLLGHGEGLSSAPRVQGWSSARLGLPGWRCVIFSRAYSLYGTVCLWVQTWSQMNDVKTVKV